MRDTEVAFKWIINILKQRKVQFQIAGGFAARLYGSTRKLADIDIDIPNNAFQLIINDVNEYVIFGPSRYVDKNWDLQLMTLKYRGQVIDIAGDSKIFDKINNRWIRQPCDFMNYTPIVVFGLTVPIIPRKALIKYKEKLLRPVDIIDINSINEEI